MARGFAFEEHQVITEDGYIMTLYRIPGKLVDQRKKTKEVGPPVLLVHGLLDSADGWLVHDDESQAF